MITAPALDVSRRTERLLVTATFITSLGNSIQLTAAAIVMARTEGTMLSVGWVFVAFSAPPILLSVVFGRLADRFDRRTLAIACDLASALVAVALPVWLLSGGSPRLGIYATTFLLSALGAMFLPASNALIKERVSAGRLGIFNAHYEMALQAGTLLSTAIGGVLVQLYSAQPLFFFNAATFLASASLLRLVGRRPARHSADPTEAAEQLTDGQPARRPPLVRLGLLLALGSPIITVSNTLLVVLILQTFRQGPGVLGIVDALAGIGFFFAAALYKRISRHTPDLRIALLGYMASAAVIVLQPRFGVPGVMLLLPLGTITFGIARVACRTMVMRAAPEQRAGFVFGATNAFGLAFSVAATVVISTISDRTSVPIGFASLAVLIIATVVLAVGLLWSERAALDAPTENAAAPTEHEAAAEGTGHAHRRNPATIQPATEGQ